MYKDRLCEPHYLQKVRIRLRKTIKAMYKGPITSFHQLMQSKVRNHLTIDDICNNQVVQRAALDKHDVKKYLLNEIFKTQD